MAIKRLVEKQLGQLNHSGSGGALSVYSPATGILAIIKSITVCATIAATPIITIYLDDNGTTYSTATKLWTVTMTAATPLLFNTYWPMNDPTGNIAFDSNVADTTITIFGVEITNA